LIKFIFSTKAIIQSAIKLYFLRNIGKIIIGKFNFIDKLVQIKIIHGGNVIIGNKNEFLFGVNILSYGGVISIGNNCSFSPYTIIYGHGKGTKIGNNVLVAAHTLIIPANHNFSRVDLNINQQGINSIGIIIEDNVWIGAGCKILDGVIIGTGSIIAAGSVVNKSIEPYSIVAGVPAKKIKSRIK